MKINLLIIKKTLLISLLLLVVFSCKDDEKDIVSPDREYTPRVIQETYGNAKLVGFVNDKNGNPLADVTVFFGEEKTTTGSDGSYQLNTLSAGSNKRIWFEKEGYAITQKLADISEELPNRIDASLFPIGKTMKMTSDGGKIETENFSVEIEPGGFVFSDGTPVEGDIIVEATAFLATDDELLNAFPGEFRGTRTDGTTTAIESFGFIDVELKIETGEPVQMAEGVMATIKIKAPENAPSIIPMWHYDEDKAKWIEEGRGTLNEGFYTANVTHFTKWNWDRPYDETSKIIGRVIDSDGNPIEGASVVQKGITYRFQNSTKTDENGEFELLTPESNDSEIEALFDIYGSTVVNYTTSPTKGYSNDIGDITIEVSLDNVMPPLISNDILYITLEQTAEIRGKYFGKEKRQGYKLLLNGNEIGTKSWENDLIEFDVPKGIPSEGTIQIDRNGVLSSEIKYEEGDRFCEVDGVIFDNTNLPVSSGRHYLNLKGRSLVKIPGCIVNLHRLDHLYLSDNQLTTLPENLGNLQNLVRLDIKNNQLTTLPESLGNLQNLLVLLLEINQLTTLPESLGNLQNLEYFSIDDNQLTTLPESLGNLQNLKGLYLNNNNLSNLPKSLVNLQNLRYLHLSGNEFINFPKIILNLQNLEYFSIDDNQLTTLSESIDTLQNLEGLYLANNKLDDLPESVFNLLSLVDLNISNNQLSSLHESIDNLQNLLRLKIENNQLTSLPESIKNLKENLKHLHLGGNNFSEEEKAKIEGWLPNTTIYW
ncbi:MAG: leucine-rich repeat domain-containing protein [Chlorobiota bacterium]